MSSYELPFRLLSKKTAIVLLFFINRLLLLRYVFVIGHQSINKAMPEIKIQNVLTSFVRKPLFRLRIS